VAARALTAHVVSPGARTTAGAAVTAAALFVLLGLVVWPLVAVVVYGVPNLARVGLAPLGALRGTLELAATSTAIIVLLGLAVAYGSTRATVFGAALAARLLLLALVLPPFLPALALRVVTAGTPVVGFPALVLSQVLAFLPVAFLILGHTLAAANADEEDAAESLGAGGLTIFMRVTLPQLRPALATATTGIFLLCTADFANPFVIGGDHAVLSVEAYLKAVRAGDLGAGVATALWLLAPCLVAAALGGWRAGAVFTLPAARRRPQRPTPASVAGPLTAVTTLVALVLAAVWTIVVGEALASARSVDWMPLGTSVVLATAASGVGAVLALAVGGLVGRRGSGAGATLLERLALLPAAVPGLILGLGYLLVYARPPIDLGATLWVIVPAVVAARLPAAVAAAVAAVRQVDPDVAAAALGLGAGRRRLISRVLAPVLAPAAASILVYFFVRALVAVSVVTALTGSRDRVASVTAVADAAAGRVGDACALAAALSVVVIVVVALRRTLPGRSLAAVWFP
jgi:iron(III) transport system permease protein